MISRSTRGGEAGVGRGTGSTGVDDQRRWRLVRASNDAVPPSVRRFMRRARRRRLRAALPWMSLGTLLLLVLFAAWMIYGTAVFGVRQVRVVGVELLTAEQVRRAAAVPTGTPLARVDLAAVQHRVAELAPAERVAVSRDWPSTLLIEVVERTGVATVPQRGRYVVVDAAGVVFRSLPDRPAGLPLLRVDTPGRTDAETRAGLVTLAALTPELRALLSEVVVQGPAGIRLRLVDGRTVVWGDETRAETKARVATALLDKEGKVIDVSAPDVVTIQ